MPTLALAADERVAEVKFSQQTLVVTLKDGRIISVPLAWYPRLSAATSAQRQHWQIAGGGYGIHWPEIDEDLSTEGLLRGAPAPLWTSARTQNIRRLTAQRRRDLAALKRTVAALQKTVGFLEAQGKRRVAR